MLKRLALMLALAGGVGFAANDAAAQDQPAQGQETKEISGTVLGVEGKTLWIEGDQGAAIPVRVTHQTQLEGQRLKRDQRIEPHLKKQFQPGEEVRASFTLNKKHLGKEENAAVSIEKQK